MIIQVFGTPKCKDTRKAERFFKERRIKIQLVDLREKGLSPGELRNISQSVPLDELIDTEGKQYRDRNLEYMSFYGFAPTYDLSNFGQASNAIRIENDYLAWLLCDACQDPGRRCFEAKEPTSSSAGYGSSGM